MFVKSNGTERWQRVDVDWARRQSKTVGKLVATLLSCRAKRSFRVELHDVGPLTTTRLGRKSEWIARKICRWDCDERTKNPV